MRIRVFQSGKGDCLLLRSAANDHILIDGGLVSNREDLAELPVSINISLGTIGGAHEAVPSAAVPRLPNPMWLPF